MSNLATSKNSKLVLTFGVFDPLHKGHLNLLKQAKKLGSHLTVIVARDSFIKKVKKRKPIVNEKDRKEKIKELSCVDEVLFGDEWPTPDHFGLLDKLKFDVVALGYDQSPPVDKVVKELQARDKKDVLVVRLKSFFPEKYKSSYFRKYPKDYKLMTND